MRKKRRAAVVGATGIAGQQFLVALADHPWFEVTALAASGRSAGRPYREAIRDANGARRWWCLEEPARAFLDLPVQNASELDATSVDIVFSGHEHIYERAEMQNGILYFITGGAGSLREGDAAPSSLIARGYDRDYHFMLAEIDDDGFFWQAINRVGVTIDAGSLKRPTADKTDHQ